MDTQEIKRLIASASPELKAAGLSAVYLFGSQARGDARDDSDVDLAFDVADEANARFSLLDQIGIQLKLQDMLGCKVDFIERRGFRPRFREYVEPDMIRLI